MSFEDSLAFTLRWEGGTSDRADDPGRLTRFGISQRSYPDVDIRALTEFGATEIYKRDYWDKIKGDHLSEALGLVVFDYAVNSGVSRAAKVLQKLVGTKQDGAIGPKTLASVGGLDAEPLMERYILERVNFLIALNKPQFLRGWMRRVVSLSIEAGMTLAA